MLAHLDDVCSDLSVLHGIRDASLLPAAAFFKLAERLPAYQGVIAAIAAQQQAPAGSNGRPAHTGSPDPAAAPGVIVADTQTLLSHPAFAPMPGEAPVITVTGGQDGRGLQDC